MKSDDETNKDKYGDKNSGGGGTERNVKGEEKGRSDNKVEDFSNISANGYVQEVATAAAAAAVSTNINR